MQHFCKSGTGAIFQGRDLRKMAFSLLYKAILVQG